MRSGRKPPVSSGPGFAMTAMRPIPAVEAQRAPSRKRTFLPRPMMAELGGQRPKGGAKFKTFAPPVDRFQPVPVGLRRSVLRPIADPVYN